MAIALDTLAYARRLREAGFSEQQAEGQAEALAAAMSDTLATKQDLQEMETRTAAGFASVRHEIRELESRMEIRFERIESRFQEQHARMQTGLADLERRMTMRLGGIMIAGIGALSALVTLA